jgi:diadenosine tetraphosphate (Ap4A) HIT family hydrolase
LEPQDQLQLWRETTLLSQILNTLFAADKLNVAALGNVVSQLHMHVIVRKRDDIAWPSPVWGKHSAQPYTGEQFASILGVLQGASLEDFQFAEQSS